MKRTFFLSSTLIESACICWWLLLAGQNGLCAEPAARIREEAITLPTYKVAAPDVNPRFYSGRTYQGAKATFYPYPVSDQMTELRQPESYRAVYLENRYIQIAVLPEIGGRIFSAIDKGNGYDFFYHQHVIKPALIGMLGAWISGGVEWNVPHHHRASSFLPVDYLTQTNRDGSVTVWVGETEWRHRMQWRVGLTVYPDRSGIEMSMKLWNGTPYAHPILFWINPAVHANENYQVIFPPDAEWAVQHAKPEFASWPIAHQRYGGTDYTRGVDISWWKNHSSPVSFFCFHSDEDFFGGYDHGKQAGVLHWADHNMVPGKKFFEWGNGPEGKMWNQVLSDEDGPYLELMAGAWSDNQPDYGWVQPGEVREWKHYWYPIRNLGGLKAATREAAMNLSVTNKTVTVAFNATREQRQAQVRLEAGGRVLYEKSISISPTQPFRADIPLAEPVAPDQIRASLRSAAGDELVAYQAKPPRNTPMPKPVERPKSPKDYATADELYYTGQRIEQLYSPSFEAEPYYEEMLRRDPGDERAHTALGILACRLWRWGDAEKHLRAALERSTANYIRPKDGEAFYYLGLALKALGQTDAAFEAYYKSTWSAGWQAPAFYALAQIANAQGDSARALELVNRSLTANAHHTKALNLKTALLRRQGRGTEAIELAQQSLSIDPLDFRALYEMSLVERQAGKPRNAEKTLARFTGLMRGDTQAYLEMAMDYAGSGMRLEAAALLERFAAAAPDRARVSPLVYYYLGYFADKDGRAEEAGRQYAAAARMPSDYCFPFRFEESVILRRAMEANPSDARAAYYLGCLLFDNQPVEAIQAWERSRELDPAFALVHRNLGLAYAQQEKNPAKAITSLERAVELNPNDPRICYELDVQYEAGGAALKKRLELFERHRAVIARRDDATARFAVLLTSAGQSEEALRILRERHFHNWEGSSDLHDIYVNACLVHGLDQLKAGHPADALRDFEAALAYPVNQEVGQSRSEYRVAQIYYLIGMAQSGLQASGPANAAFRKAAGARENNASEARYYKALALQKTGQPEEAGKLFAGLVSFGRAEADRSTEAVDYFAKFGEKRSERVRLAQAHFLAGLGYLGQDNEAEAQREFAKTLELHPSHLGALTWKQHRL